MATIQNGDYAFAYELPISTDSNGNSSVFYDGSAKGLVQINPYNLPKIAWVYSNIYVPPDARAPVGSSGTYIRSNVDNLVLFITYNGQSTPPTGSQSSTTVVNVVVSMTGPATKTWNLSYTIYPQVTKVTTIAFTNYQKTYDGVAYDMLAQVKTNTTATPSMSYSGISGTVYGPSSTPPTQAGSYLATVSYPANSAYTAASASAYLTINKISSVSSFFFNTDQAYYTGSAIPLTCTTLPTGLSYSVTYDGSNTAPTNIGSYTVVATITDSNVSPTAGNSQIIGTYNIVRSNQIPSSAANSTTIVRATYSAAIGKFLVDFVGTYQ